MTGWKITAIVLAAATFASFVVGGGAYLFGVFVSMPLAVGAIVDLVCRPKSLGRAIGYSALTLTLLGAALLLFKVEGAICLIMAAPIQYPCAMFGAAISYQIRRARPKATAHMLAAALLLSPLTVGAEATWPHEVPTFEVSTSIEINAPPEVVWKHVTDFPKIPEERDWIFRMGIGYPTRSDIHGAEAGAARECIFSTGTMTERVDIFDQPRLLRFAVLQSPVPMKEWSPYPELDAPHLHNYLVGKAGQFRLIALPGNRTRVEGTSWYQHHLEPARYWRVWTDFIAHRIHQRVLEHVKRLAESDGQ